MEKKKNLSVLGVVLLLVGIALILFGAIAPSIIFSKNNTFTVESDMRMFDTEYEITLVTKEPLNLNSGVFTINNDKYDVKITPDEDEPFEFGFEIIVEQEFGNSPFDNEYKFKANTIDGKEITFKYADEFSHTALKWVATIAPIMFGVGFVMMGIVWLVIKPKAQKAAKAMTDTVFGTADGSNVGIVGVIKDKVRGPQEKECEYCGCINAPEKTKCTECGAPLKK